jgi:hypothetical protein
MVVLSKLVLGRQVSDVLYRLMFRNTTRTVLKLLPWKSLAVGHASFKLPGVLRCIGVIWYIVMH